MKKLTILLIFSFAVCVFGWQSKKQNQTPGVLKEYPFNMTYDELLKKHNKISMIWTNGGNYHYVPKVFLNYNNAKLCFLFSDKPVRIVVIPLKKESDPHRYVAEYNKLKNIISKKYGFPKTSKTEYKQGLSSQKIRQYNKKMSGKDVALGEGDLFYITKWDCKDFKIELKCYKETNPVGHFINLAYICKNKPSSKPQSKNAGISEI